MDMPRPILGALALLLGLGNCRVAADKDPEFNSTEAYRQIVRSTSVADVVDAIERLAEHYQKHLAAGKISSESERELILEAIPVIIEHMDDRDQELAINVFNVLASLQADCPAPLKKNWNEWWNRKQNGEPIIWMVEFGEGTKQKTRSNKSAAGQPATRPESK